MTPETRRAGEAIARAAPELARLWRGARRHARADPVPGLIDGIVEDFLARAGEGLAGGRDPALIWPETVGIVRFDPRAAFRSQDEIELEWDLVDRVLSSARTALHADEAAEWLSRAVLIARNGSRTVHAHAGPPGIVVVWLLSGLGPTPPAGRGGGRR